MKRNGSQCNGCPLAHTTNAQPKKRRQKPHTACEHWPICACTETKLPHSSSRNADRLCTKRYMIRSPAVQLMFCLCVVSIRSLSLAHSLKKPKSRTPQRFYYLLITRDPDFESRTRRFVSNRREFFEEEHEITTRPVCSHFSEIAVTYSIDI